METHEKKMRPFLDPNSDLVRGIILFIDGELLSASELDRKIPEDAEFLVGLPPF